MPIFREPQHDLNQKIAVTILEYTLGLHLEFLCYALKLKNSKLSKNYIKIMAMASLNCGLNKFFISMCPKWVFNLQFKNENKERTFPRVKMFYKCSTTHTRKNLPFFD